MSAKSERIMIVDDDKASREILKELLQPKFECVTASDGEAAVNTFIESFRDPKEQNIDLILLDFEMPGDNGLDVLIRLKEEETKRKIPKDKRVKVIMTTSHNDRDIVMACKAAGAHQYLLKPIQESALIKKINLLLPPESTAISGEVPTDTAEF